MPFFRATVFSHYSPFNAPKGYWSLMTEVSGSSFRPFPRGDIVDAVIRGARAVKLIAPNDRIVSTWSYRADHGYPTPTLGRDQYLNIVLPRLAKHNVYSRGRFGAWKYEVSNQDHTFMQGVEWANHVLLSQQEMTVNNPALVNRKKR